jgi:hypothetical protein
LDATQIILLSQWFNKKTNQKDLIKMVESKLTFRKWHFGQVGHEGKRTIWGVFFKQFFDKKKAMISYDGCNGGMFMLTKVGSKLVHSIIPNERKWLLVLSSINAHGNCIPNFYIFKSK